MQYVELDNYNFIIGHGNLPNIPLGAIEMEGSFIFGRSYVEKGKIITLPHPPSENHVVDKVNKVWVLDENKASNNVKNKRNLLLKESDWTQLPDVPIITRNTWLDYRQELRDITLQVGYPFDIIWPQEPKV